MPARAKGPRLYLRRERRDPQGRLTHAAVWLIRDTGRPDASTGCGPHDIAGAERELEAYLAGKHVTKAAEGQRRASEIEIADVVSVYARDIAPKHSRPGETAQRLGKLLDYFGDGKRLSQLSGQACRDYARWRGSDAAARRELEDLRSAVNHYHAEGLVHERIKVVLPERSPMREHWMTRQQAAAFVRSAWRFEETDADAPHGHRGINTARRRLDDGSFGPTFYYAWRGGPRLPGKPGERAFERAYAAAIKAKPRTFPRRHVARFTLVGLYTGTRSGAIVRASFYPERGRGYVDVDRGVFYRRAPGARETKKRQPSVPLPRRLLAHLRRWKRLGQRYVVEYRGRPIDRMAKAFRQNARDCGLEWATPHVLRHTAATWGMQRSADPWRLAEFLGMSLKMLLDRYGHHHPDHLREGWSVFDRPGGEPKKRPPQIPIASRGRKVNAGSRKAGKKSTKRRRA